MDSLVRLEKVSKSFGAPGSENHVLTDVNLDIATGEYLALMGRSGSGKSTLLNIMAGLLRPTSGLVEVCGERLDGRSEEEAARFRLAHGGFVFQAFHLLPRLTVWENVAVPLVLRGGRGAGRGARHGIQERARAELERFGLAEVADRRPAGLSGGQQQRVAIARALVTDPPLLAADEPTGNLDAASAEEVLEAFDEVRSRYHATIVVVTHDEQVAARAESRRYVVDGRISETAAEPVGRAR